MLSAALEEHAKALAEFSSRFGQDLTVEDVIHNLCPEESHRARVTNVARLADLRPEIISREAVWNEYANSRDASLKNGLRDVKNLTWCKMARECGLACALGDPRDPEIFAMMSKEGEEISLWNVKFFKDSKNSASLLRCDCPEIVRINVLDDKPIALAKLREANEGCDVII